MGQIKVFGTIVLENVPQLMCQLLYAYALNTITQAVQLAFIASLLSVTASALSYLIERDTSDTKVVSYYLAFECVDDRVFDDGTDDDGNEDDDDQFKDFQTNTMRELSIYTNNGEEAENSVENNAITDDEKQLILQNRGRREKLGEHVAEVYGTTTKNIEIGESRITNCGIITHVIHYVYSDDLETMEENLNSKVNQEIEITPRYFTEQLFLTVQAQITNVFRKHFQLNKDFIVRYDNKARTRNQSKYYNSNNNEILQKVVTRMQLNIDSDDDEQSGRNLLKELQTLFTINAVANKDQGLDVLSNVLDSNIEHLFCDQVDEKKIDNSYLQIENKNRTNNVQQNTIDKTYDEQKKSVQMVSLNRVRSYEQINDTYDINQEKIDNFNVEDYNEILSLPANEI
eukprot:96094_1